MTLLVNRLRDDENEPDAFTDEEGRAFITEATNAVLSEAITAMQQAIVTQLEARLSHLDERLTMQDARQADVLARFKAEQTSAITETSETMTAMVETTLRKRDVRETVSPVPSSKMRSISDAPSRKGAERDIDKIIWPLLNSGLTVWAIAERAETSTATVGRSRKRWEAQKDVSVDQPETDRTEMLVTNS